MKPKTQFKERKYLQMANVQEYIKKQVEQAKQQTALAKNKEFIGWLIGLRAWTDDNLIKAKSSVMIEKLEAEIQKIEGELK